MLVVTYFGTMFEMMQHLGDGDAALKSQPPCLNSPVRSTSTVPVDLIMNGYNCVLLDTRPLRCEGPEARAPKRGPRR